MRHVRPSLYVSLGARWLHGVALALWLGGLIAIGALVAPTAFHVVRASAVLAGQSASQSEIAGGIVGGSLREFNVLCLACGAVMLLADVILGATGPPRHTPSLWCGLLTLLLLALTAYLGWGVFPMMDAAQAHGQLAAFDRLHIRYERLSGWEMPLLLLLMALAIVRDADRPAAA